MLDRRIVELDHREGSGRGRERHLACRASGVPSTTGAGPTTLSGATASPCGEIDDVLEPVAPDAQHEPGRERVDDGNADAMQAAGDLVGVLVEFPARVQLGHDDFGGRDALFVVDAGRNAAPVVGDGAGAVGVERHGRRAWRGRPAPRRWRCRRPRRPCDAGRSRRRCRRYTCPAACAPRRGRAAP